MTHEENINDACKRILDQELNIDMASYKDRCEQREVVETMNVLLLPLLPYLNNKTAIVVKRALYLLRKIDIKPQKREE